jgi:CheY-like chemotaxis protein
VGTLYKSWQSKTLGIEPESIKILQPTASKKRARAADMATKKTDQQLILVIDDEQAVREAVKDILEFEGIEVITAVDGESGIALYKARQAEITLVLLDLSMPGLNGAETFQQIRQINPNASVLLSSGYDEVEATRYLLGLALAPVLVLYPR